MPKQKKRTAVVPGAEAKAAIVAREAANMADRDLEKRKEAAMALGESGWGLPADARTRKALMAITQWYGLDPIMGDVIFLGNKLYITEVACKKKLDDKTNKIYEGKPWRWRKRTATADEVEDLGYGKRQNPAVWYVELLPPEGHGNEVITTAFGECDAQNCGLQNISREQGDPRVMNRMAIKRAQHECSRDVAVFKLPSIDRFEEVMGMAMEEMMKIGVQVIVDDGLQNATGGYNLSEQAAIAGEPEGSRTEALAAKVTGQQKTESEPPAEPTPPGEPTTDGYEPPSPEQVHAAAHRLEGLPQPAADGNNEPPAQEPADDDIHSGDPDGPPGEDIPFNY